jgi:hypothetical protein
VLLGELPDKAKLTAWLWHSKFIFDVSGTEDTIVEICEQLAWLGAALRSSPSDIGVAYCTPSISVTNSVNPMPGASLDTKTYCKIDFAVKVDEEHFSPSNGQCWHGMFRNPVVVLGYPIARRSAPDTGLEMPLNMMARLTGTKRINTFNGKLFIKGFSTMLVPTRKEGNHLIWHLLYNEDRSHISYLDSTVAHAENISDLHLEKSRHIVGWCSDVRYCAGKKKNDV